jgi:hypothetical protein
MIEGMYVNFDLWEILIESKEAIGKKGGIRISNRRTKRYLNNSEFITLLKGGWIGSNGITSDNLTQIIKDSLEGKNSVVLAHSIEKKPRKSYK